MKAIIGLTGFIVMILTVAVNAAPSASSPATTQAAARGEEEILADISSAGKELGQSLSSPDVLTDPKKRDEAAPKILSSLKKMTALTAELAKTDPNGKMIALQIRGEVLPMLATFGGDAEQAEIQKLAASTDADEAGQAKGALLLSKWWKTNGDAVQQAKLIDEATQLAKDNPQSQQVAGALRGMSQLGAANPELSGKVQDVIFTNMKGDFVDQIKTEVEGERKMKSIEGKPMTIAGTTVEGKPFSTADLKGKVILIDFWATWCGPCKEELPRVKKAYADFHEKGLEVLGVSNDYKADDLKNFVAADPAMPWPQLFDSKAAADQQWNPITTGYGINGIPTMFLIDKKGVCRSVTARENFEEVIPKLLAE